MTRVRGLVYPLLCCPLPHSALLHPSSFGQIFQICRCSIPVSNFSTFYSLSLGWLVVSLAQGTLALLPPDLGILALSNFPAASSRLPGLPCPSNFFFQPPRLAGRTPYQPGISPPGAQTLGHPGPFPILFFSLLLAGWWLLPVNSPVFGTSWSLFLFHCLLAISVTLSNQNLLTSARNILIPVADLFGKTPPFPLATAFELFFLSLELFPRFPRSSKSA